jgi:hypothetical protein
MLNLTNIRIEGAEGYDEPLQKHWSNNQARCAGRISPRDATYEDWRKKGR